MMSSVSTGPVIYQKHKDIVTADGWIMSTHSSLISTVLPMSLRRRVPRLRSLYDRGITSTEPVESDSRPSSSDGASGTRTPPPSYEDTLTPMTLIVNSSEGRLVEDADSSTPFFRRPEKATLVEGMTGIQWKFASQGSSLLTLSAQESASSSPNTSLSRQLYIHSLTYLLQGLPETLTPEETTSLRAALPAELILQEQQHRQSLSGREGNTVRRRDIQEQPTILHRLISTATIQIFILLALVLPYVRLFVQTAYRYEREHHISERLFSHTLTSADAIGKRAFTIGQAVCSINDGRVGELVEEVLGWWIKGITGGIHEGVGEGMEVLGLWSEKRRMRPRRR